MTMGIDDIYDLALEDVGKKLYFFAQNLPVLLEQLYGMETRMSAGNELMRLFHSLKGVAGYAKQPNVQSFAHQVEDVISAIIRNQKRLDKKVQAWFETVHAHVSQWSEQLEDGDSNLEAFEDDTVQTVVYSTTTLYENMKKCTLIVVGNETLNKKQTETIRSYVGALMTAETLQEVIRFAESNPKERFVLIVNAIKDNKLMIKAIEQVSTRLEHVPVVVLENRQLPAKYKMAYVENKEIDFLIDYPFNVEFFQNVMELIVGNNFMEKQVKINKNDALMLRVEALAPLSETSKELNRLRSDKDATLKEVSDVIMRDSSIGMSLLKTVSSPAIGLSHNVTSVHQAITLLGKDRVIAIALQADIEKILKVELEAYGMDEKLFYEIAYKRMNLMLHWFLKVNLSKVGLLTTAALIGNIGQIIIAGLIAKRSLTDEFRQMVKEAGAKKAEMEMLQITAESVTADILTHWQVDSQLINAIRHSDNPANAPEEFREEAFALSVIYSLIPSHTAEINLRTVEMMASDISMREMNSRAFRNALEKI